MIPCFFRAWRFECQELVRKSMEKKMESMLKNVGMKSCHEIGEADISDKFGL